MVSTSTNSDLIPLRYNITKDAPGKMPKGAGLLNPVTGATWPFSYTLTVENNTPLESIVSIHDSLPNGVAFLNELTVSGPDIVALSSITIIPPSPGQNYTALDWTNVKLSADCINYITYEVAIWDNYTINGIENSGSPILHGTPLTNRATISGISGDVSATATTNAMNALIIKKQSPSVIDVDSTIHYSITYEVNQYDDVNGFTVTHTMMDGQAYDIGSNNRHCESRWHHNPCLFPWKLPNEF